MKKILFALFSIIAIISCTRTEFSDPGFNGKRNNVTWKASSTYAVSNSDGGISIIGVEGFETVTLKIQGSGTPGPGAGETTYLISGTSANQATVEVTDGTNTQTYTTQSVPGITNSGGDGKIVIKNNSLSTGFLYGTYWFRAKLGGAGTEIGFSQGTFYNVPLSGAIVDDGSADSFNVKINGADLNPSTIVTANTGGQLAITAASATNSVNLVMDSSITAGTHTINAATTVPYGVLVSGTTTSNSISGTLTISAHDTAAQTISGTFSFTAENSNDLTEGTFSVSY